MPTIFFFFTATSTTGIYTLSLHDALPISGGVEYLVVWRENHGRGNSLLDGIAVCGNEVEVAVEVPDVHLDDLELSSKQLRALAALDCAVQGAAVLAPVRAEDDENGSATLLCGGERLSNGRLGVGRFIVWKRRT